MNDRRTAQSRYEAAIARAHRAVHNAKQRALDMEWTVEADQLHGMLLELSELGQEALRGRRRRSPQLEGQDELPFA